MHPVFLRRGAAPTVPISFATAATWPEQRAGLDPRARAFVEAAGFEPKPGRHVLLPAPDGGLAGALFGLEPAEDAAKDTFRPGALPGLLRAPRTDECRLGFVSRTTRWKRAE